jgi:ubiquinone/menaquinone biosynthesis C-methylase UbiE
MSAFKSILMRMFGRPRGVLGRLGGVIMARMNQQCAAWVIDLLEVQPNDRILEVGFGPGVGIELLAKAAPEGYVAGVDPSQEMVDQARARNAQAIISGHVDLRYGSAESLPFDDNTFNKALAINSMHVWTDAAAGLREIRRVMQAGGRMALGFTPYAGQRQGGLTDRLTAAGLAEAHVVETETGFCVLAINP